MPCRKRKRRDCIDLVEFLNFSFPAGGQMTVSRRKTNFAFHLMMPLIPFLPSRRILKWVCLLFCGPCRFAGAATFTVTTAADSDPGLPLVEGSLRWAIQSSNDHSSGPNVINFNVGLGIPGIPITIAPHSPLPALTVPVTIDGTTQPGFPGTPIVELSGIAAGAGASGIHVKGGASTIRGLVINRFTDSGIRIEQIGGNVIEGNYIGTDVTGLVGLGNTYEGIVIENGASNNRVGGLSAAARNVICNNKQTGIFVRDNASNNQILGNYVGVGATGANALGNAIAGILIKTASNVVGGTAPGAGNVVSANGWSGIYLYTTGATGNLVQGNLLGTDATGLVALGNKDRGVAILDGSGNIIGGVTVAARNLISGNLQSGLLIDGLSTNTLVQGNYIGTDITGMLGLGNGIDGVEIRSARDNTIGGSVQGAGNLISGNQQSGVSIFETPASGNSVLGNLIGTKAGGTGALGNRQYGVFVFYSAANNVIGGVGRGQGNVIAFNCAENPGYDGVRLHITAGQGNRISGNSIRSNNGGLGIDIGINGVTLNDPADADQLQNFPLLICAASHGARTIIYGTLTSVANQAFTVEVFSSSVGHPTGSGPGERFNGATPVSTDASGAGRFAIAFPTASLAGSYISATTTNLSNATSEFSAQMAVNSTDTDGDGLPDAFETAFSLNPTDPGDAAKDADGDGSSNLQEFLAATDPSIPTSVLRISTLERSGGAVASSFRSVSGVRYRLETNPDLVAPWAAARLDIVGTGGTVRVTVPTDITATREFFRIVAVP